MLVEHKSVSCMAMHIRALYGCSVALMYQYLVLHCALQVEAVFLSVPDVLIDTGIPF
jgi:hypothetical protein